MEGFPPHFFYLLIFHMGNENLKKYLVWLLVKKLIHMGISQENIIDDMKNKKQK